MKVRIVHPVLRDFFDQLRFAPAEQKKKQLAAAEHLMLILDASREYPYDFIVYKITGYRLRAEHDHPLIHGRDLRQALSVWIAGLSDRLELSAADQTEPLITVEQLAEKFSVCTKTIRRWQSRGLLGRIYLFPDGKKRAAFTESAVSAFAAAHPSLIARAGRFSQVDAAQKAEIRQKARELAAAGKFRTQNQFIMAVAKKVGRARLTVKAVLNETSGTAPAAAVPGCRGKLNAKDVQALCRLSQQGVSVRELSERFGRSRSSVYRIISRQRVRELFVRKIEYIHSDEFERPGADKAILTCPLDQLAPVRNGEPALLSRRQEAELFRRYNYLKFLALRQRAILQDNPRAMRVRTVTDLLRQADAVKTAIIEANMPLVVSIAQKHLVSGHPMADLVSEGSVSLMAAVEKFDYTRGYRFSTYASWAIVKDFARLIPAEARRPDRGTGADLANLPINLRIEQFPDISAVEQLQQNLRQIIINNLDQREQYIIFNHYALDTGVIPKKPKTLKQIGSELGITKERVRQIELQALQKLRQSLSPEQFDLLTG